MTKSEIIKQFCQKTGIQFIDVRSKNPEKTMDKTLQKIQAKIEHREDEDLGLDNKKIIHHYQFDDKSAITQVDIEDRTRRLLATGISICSPKDQFSRKKGVLMATGRAKKAMRMRKSLSRMINRKVENDNEAFRVAEKAWGWKGNYFTS